MSVFTGFICKIKELNENEVSESVSVQIKNFIEGTSTLTGGKIHVNVKTLTGKTIEIEISPSDTI